MKLATTHINADMDGMASLVALYLLEGPFELAVPGSMDPSAHGFWLDHGQELPDLVPPRNLRSRLESEPLERLYVVDTADPDRLGVIGEYVSEFEQVRAYDNHPRSPSDLPVVPMPPVCACVSAIVLQLADRGVVPTPTEAGLFLLGIHVDTGHFTFLGTTELDHRAAAICLSWGAPVDWPGRYAPKGYTSRQLELLERMAHNLEFVDEGGHSVAVVSLELESYEPDLSVLLEQLRDAEGWASAFLLASCADRIFAIGRSRGPLNAAAIVRPMGGGGHAEAASAVLRGATLRDARALLRQTLLEELGERRTAKDVAEGHFHSLPMTATIGETSDALHRLRINALPLYRKRGGRKRFVGLISRQEVDAAMRHGLGDREVADITHTQPVWVSPDSPLSEARNALISGLSRLVLVGEPPDRAVGVLTRSTLFRTLADDPPLAERKRPPRPNTVRGLARKALGEAWELVTALGELAAQMDTPLHLVGGTVRDILLKLPIRDIDLVAEGHAPAVARKAREQFGGSVRVHEAFATATWASPSGVEIDIASTRSEYYEAPAALPRITHAGLRQDLYRRDFTINAMAVSLEPDRVGQVRDPFGGIADINHGIIRVIHGLSFYDDPTRAWRAGRFAARLDFKVAPETVGLIKAALHSGAFARLGRERLGTEIDLILEELEVEQAFRLLRQWRLLEEIHEKLASRRRLLDALSRVQAARHRYLGLVEAVPRQSDVLWLVLARAIPREERAPLKRLVPGGVRRQRLWTEGPERVASALHALRKAERHSDAGRVLAKLAISERVAALGLSARPPVEDWIIWWEREGRAIRSGVSGNTLLARGHRPGPALGRALDAALDAARDGAGAAAQLAAAEEILAKSAAMPHEYSMSERRPPSGSERT